MQAVLENLMVQLVWQITPIRKKIKTVRIMWMCVQI